jgi:hypothetical protein
MSGFCAHMFLLCLNLGWQFFSLTGGFWDGQSEVLLATTDIEKILAKKPMHGIEYAPAYMRDCFQPSLWDSIVPPILSRR